MSGYAYLGMARLREIARKHGCTITHAPVDIQAVFAASGVTPPATQSLGRRAYRIADMQRWAKRRNLPLNVTPLHWPVSGALAAKYIVASETLAHRSSDMSAAVLAAVWARDLDISSEPVLMQLAQEIGIDAPELQKLAAESRTAAVTERLTQQALALQLFGSPTYVLGGDIFFWAGPPRFSRGCTDRGQKLARLLRELSAAPHSKRSAYVTVQESFRQDTESARLFLRPTRLPGAARARLLCRGGYRRRRHAAADCRNRRHARHVP